MSDLPIWRNGAFHADEWVRFAADVEPLPGAPLLVPLAVFRADIERFLGRDGPLGVELSAGESAAVLEPYLWRLAMVTLAFPKFHDGRNYSAARLLRERYGYKGEIRAVGDVLADQIPLMRRCGVTSFEVTHEPTRAALLAGRLAEVRHYYQPIPNQPEVPVGTRPWLRQPAA
jgi:phosphoadenosine phosphosulfate reductase